MSDFSIILWWLGLGIGLRALNEFPIHQTFIVAFCKIISILASGFEMALACLLAICRAMWSWSLAMINQFVPYICYIYGKEVPEEDLVRMLKDSSLAEQDSNVVSIKTELDIWA